ncbi:porin family protein [[Pseudomonas] carboxydohydrogena]|uniref:Porin family protein n=2 Tax=Afipia carboxydohydrogena TaxID=290 RepID=A0ABY8BLS3_AFICR|nr:outer membrane protein [[Pseudomonas] carboxydohydrogena]WEF50644.1 porin family protein [[Pseudomonas] carboxydohydrogena]
MKKLLLAVTVAALSSTSVFAADLAARPYTKAPAYVAPIYNWTGFYIGAHIGGAFGGSNSVTDFTGTGIASNNKSAFLGGAQIGYNYQFSPNWVFGIEGDFSGLSSNNRTFVTATDVYTAKSDWLASVTGRLGYTWGPGMIYAKGGAAFRDNSMAGTTPFVTTRDDTGYTVGAGLEYMFAPAWSAKIEYQYYNFGHTSVADAVGPVLRYSDDLHTVKAGINYHFNWGGPVVAKY